MPARTKIDRKVKEQAVTDVLGGQLTREEAVSKYRVHPYQLDAWIGQALLRERDRGSRSVSIIPRSSKMPSPSIADMLTGDDPVRRIGEWYIRTVILKEPGPKTPPGLDDLSK